MKKSILALLLLTMLFSCKKDGPKQYSTWYVNGQKSTTNDIRKDEGKAQHELTTNNISNGFSITFHTGSYPTSGVFPLNYTTSDPSTAELAIFYRDTGYLAKPTSYITASIRNGKASYNLIESWFYNSYRPDEDSILVKGVFNEP